MQALFNVEVTTRASKKSEREFRKARTPAFAALDAPSQACAVREPRALLPVLQASEGACAATRWR